MEKEENLSKDAKILILAVYKDVYNDPFSRCDVINISKLQ